MDSLSATILIFLVVLHSKQQEGFLFREKPGSCPMYRVMSSSAICQQEESECDYDDACSGNLKCCEGERCGTSKCTEPVTDVVPTRRIERCPVEGFQMNAGCVNIETTFCYKSQCRRCCTHKNTCNPAKETLRTVAECHKELCEKHPCKQQGSSCNVDKDNHIPRCLCKKVCPKMKVFVCGDNGITYDNMCSLEKAACEKQSTIVVAKVGQCSQVNTTPKTVNHAPEITVDSNLIKSGDTKYMRSGQSIQFRCKRKTGGAIEWYKLRTTLQGVVPILIPHSMTYKQGQDILELNIDRIVLANAGVYSCRENHQGRIYSSKVMLNVSAPENYKDICLLPSNPGPCDGAFQNYYYDVKDDQCKLFQYGGCKGNNNNFEGLDQCKKYCKGTKLPCPKDQASSDGRCPFNPRHQCSKSTDCSGRSNCCLVRCIKRCISSNSASTMEPPVTNKITQVSCGRYTCKYHAKCKANKFGIKECFCPDGCSFQALSPVCGRDSFTGQSKTFRSPCFLFYNSCKLQREITMTRLSPCPGQAAQNKQIANLCDVKRCSVYAKCVISPFTKQPICICPRFCRFTRKLVCGTDGRTYFNECFLKVTSCKKDLYVSVAKNGRCESK